MGRSHGIPFVAFAISALTMGFLIITAIYMYRGGKENNDKVMMGPIKRADKLECNSLLSKIQTAVNLYYYENGRYPEKLEDVPDLSGQSFNCPVTQRPYIYDQLSGKIICTDHQ